MIKNWNKVCIHVHNQKEKLAALEFLSKMTGFAIGDTTLIETQENHNIEKYSYVRAGVNLIHGYCDNGGDGSCYQTVEFDKIHELLLNEEKEPIKVILNNEYSAIVYDGFVTVGCKKFTFEAIDALHQAVEKQRKS